MSAPAENASPPAPAMTTALISRSASQLPEQPGHGAPHFEAEGVALAGTVNGDRGQRRLAVDENAAVEQLFSQCFLPGCVSVIMHLKEVDCVRYPAISREDCDFAISRANTASSR